MKIVVIRGFGDTMATTIQPSCGIFEPSTNEWSLVSSPGYPLAAGSAVSIGDIVECFDVRSNKWHEIATMPSSIIA